MKTVNKSAKVETAFGQTLAEPVTFGYSYEELEKGDAIPEKEKPDADDLRTYVNQKRNSKARAEQQTKALTAAGITAPTLEDPDFQFKSLVKTMLAAGKSQADARNFAGMALDMTEDKWPDTSGIRSGK